MAGTELVDSASPTGLDSKADLERLRSIMDQLPVGVLILEGQSLEDSVVAATNRVFAEIAGVHPAPGARITALPYRYCDPLCGGELPFEEWPSLRALGSGSAISSHELQLRRPDGTRRLVVAGATPVRDEGHLWGAVVFAQDVTAQKAAAGALRESEARERARAAVLEAVLEAVPGAVLIARDPEVQHVEGNRAAHELMDVPVGTNFSKQYTPPGKQPLSFRLLSEGAEIPAEELPLKAAASRSAKVEDREFDLVRADGTERRLLVNAAPLRDAAGQPSGAVEIITDITVRRRAEQRMAALQEITSALAGALTVKQVAAVVLRHGQRALGAQTAALVLRAQGSSEIELVDEIDVLPEMRAAYQRFDERARNPMTEAMRTGNEVIFESAAAWQAAFPEAAAQPHSLALSSFMAFPLLVEGEAIGGIGFAFFRPRPFSAEERAFMRAVAGQAAQAIWRARLYEAERHARAEAQQANAAKDEFVALISHELRNPLSAIQAGTYILRHGVPPRGRLGRALEIVERNVRLQGRLVNDLLDLSRISRGKLQLQRAPLALEQVIEAAVQAHEDEAHEAGLTLTYDAAADLWVQGDFDRLQQVVSNLLSNAIKFTERGGSIRVRAVRGAESDSAALVTVADTGIGIDRRLLGQLFQLFQQGEIGALRRRGLGIGLALVRGIVEKHGGRVWAESPGLGKGSCFSVELPLTAGPAVRTAAVHLPAAAAPRAQVLLVEDNVDTRTLIADSLTLAGYDVQSAGSGEEALELLQEARPNIILCDIGLPGINGYEFLRQAKALSQLDQVPAFAVTGYGQEEDVRRSREAGFVGHFVKPIDVNALNRRMREWLVPEH